MDSDAITIAVHEPVVLAIVPCCHFDAGSG